MSGEELRFTVYGTPVAKQRARRGRGKHVFTPEETVRYERRVSLAAAEAMSAADLAPLEGACEVEVAAFWPALARAKPSSTEATRKKTRPDLDNVLKSLLDGMNGVVYVDDALVTDAHVKKRHSDRGGEPGVSVVVRSLEHEWDSA